MLLLSDQVITAMLIFRPTVAGFPSKVANLTYAQNWNIA